MNPVFEDIKRGLISLVQAVLMAGNDTVALSLLREAQARIEAALAAVEVRT